MIFHRPACQPLNLILKINNFQLNASIPSNFLAWSLPNIYIYIWDDHINHISLKIARAIGVLRNIRSLVPQHTLITIYHSLIMSHCNYQILIWGHKYHPIFKLQKRAIRILTHSHFLVHTAPLFKLLNLQTLPDTYSTALLKFYYKYVHRTLPKYHLSLNIRPNSAYRSSPNPKSSATSHPHSSSQLCHYIHMPFRHQPH